MQNTQYKLLTTFSFLLVFLATFLAFFHPIQDFSQDLGRHILLGDIVLQTHTVPTTNLFSYTYPHFPFINNDWLSEVVFAALFHSVGLWGLFLFLVLLVGGGFALLFTIAAKKSNSTTAILCLLFYLTIFLSRTLVRPEALSYFFTAVFLFILYKNRQKQTKLLFLLPFIELLWTNMHINFPVGYGLVGIFLADAVWKRLGHPEPVVIASSETTKQSTHSRFLSQSKRENDMTTIVHLFLVFLFCLFATLLNPNGLSGSLYPFTVFHNYGYAIEENQSVGFLLTHQFPIPNMPIFILAIGILFLSLVIQRKKTTLLDWLLLSVFSIGAFSAHRNFGLFAMGTYVLFSSSCFPIIQSVLAFAKKKISSMVVEIVMMSLGIFLLLFLVQKTFGLGISLTPGPQNGADFFIQHHLNGPIFNNFDIGSYLDYRLYSYPPAGGKVFVDGRPEAYPASFFQNIYIPMQESPALFQKEDEQYHFQTIFFSYIDQTPWAQQFVGEILQNKKWQLIYLDSTTMILVKIDAKNQSVIKTFGMNEKTVHATGEQNYSAKELLQLAVFFQEAGWTQEEIPILQKLLEKNPQDCPIIQALGQIYTANQNAAMVSLFEQKYAAFCQ